MITITAQQFVYTSVNADYSSDGRPGYQMCYRPQSLSDGDVDAIIERVKLVQAPPEGASWQSFALGSAGWVVSRAEAFPAEDDICDARGAMMVQGLVIEHNVLVALANNPFRVIDDFPSLSGLRDMVARFGKAVGIAPDASVTINPQRDWSSDWPADQTRALLGLACHAQSLVASDRSVAIRGSAEEIENALRLVFQLLPPAEARACSFDTCADGRPWATGALWAAGFSSPPTDRCFIQVDASEPRVDAQAHKVRSMSPSLYGSWLEDMLSRPSELPFNTRCAPTICALARGLEKGDPPSDDVNRCPEACQVLHDFAPEVVYRRLSQRVAEITTKRIATALEAKLRLWAVQGTPVTPAAVACLAAGNQFSAERVARWCEQLLLWQTPKWKKADWVAVRQLARSAGNALLLFLASVLSPRVDTAGRAQGLLGLDSMQFAGALQTLLGRVAPAHFVTPRHLAALLEEPAIRSLSGRVLSGLLSAVIREPKGGKYLDEFAPSVERLNRRQTLRHLRELRAAPDVPESFHRAVEQRAWQLKRAGILGRLLGRWRRPWGRS